MDIHGIAYPLLRISCDLDPVQGLSFSGVSKSVPGEVFFSPRTKVMIPRLECESTERWTIF